MVEEPTWIDAFPGLGRLARDVLDSLLHKQQVLQGLARLFLIDNEETAARHDGPVRGRLTSARPNGTAPRCI